MNLWTDPATRAVAISLVALGVLALMMKWAISSGLSRTDLTPEERADRNSLRVLIEGADGAASTSKFQWLIWTVAGLVAFIAVYASAPDGMTGDIDLNLILLMGMSSATMVAAKAVTSHQIATETVTKSWKPREAHHGGLILDDEGYLDLSKTQLLAWTLIGAAVFLWESWQAVQGRTGVLPHVPPQLLAFMGIGQGAYLAKKATPSSASPAAVQSVNVTVTQLPSTTEAPSSEAARP